jgi:acyl carrier protein
VTTEEIVRSFILEQFYVADSAELTVDASLIDTGIVDSMGMLDVIMFLETRMGISISDSDTIPENLETIGRIAAFVERRRMTANGTVGIDEPSAEAPA